MSKVDWKSSLIATVVLTFFFNLLVHTMSYPVLLFPIIAVVAATAFFASRSREQRERMRDLLNEQAKLGESLVRCLFDRDR